jgi:hypothetical protein
MSTSPSSGGALLGRFQRWEVAILVHGDPLERGCRIGDVQHFLYKGHILGILVYEEGGGLREK